MMLLNLDPAVYYEAEKRDILTVHEYNKLATYRFSTLLNFYLSFYNNKKKIIMWVRSGSHVGHIYNGLWANRCDPLPTLASVLVEVYSY